MVKRLQCGSFTTLSLILLAVAASAPAGAQQHGSAHAPALPLFAGEGTIRRRIKSGPMPVYPEAARLAGVQGLAAALVTHDETGAVVRVEILKAPDESIAEAVRGALKQWTFHPPSYRKPTQGTLRFNFSIEDGKGRVEYGTLDGICGQRQGRTMPDGTVRQQLLEDIDMVDCK